MIKQQFIDDLIEALNRVNSERIYNNEIPLDICYLISSLDQNIDKNKEFMDAITKYKYHFNGFEPDSEGYYGIGKIQIIIEKLNVKKEYDRYEIEFCIDERHWGYCLCTSEDENYDEEYGCCGMGCDWNASMFYIRKIIELDEGRWNGHEKDYWAYEKQFNLKEKYKNEEVEKYEKNQKKMRIKEKIKELQIELFKLE